MSDIARDPVPEPSDRPITKPAAANCPLPRAPQDHPSFCNAHYQPRWDPAWVPEPSLEQPDSTYSGEHLVASLQPWLGVELEMHDFPRNRPGIPEVGAEAWFGRKVVQWAHKLPEHTPDECPAGSFDVIRCLCVPIPSRTGGFTRLDPVILRRGVPDLVVRIEPDDPRDGRAALEAIESAALTGAVAVYISGDSAFACPRAPCT